ncbi:MAG: hypothetical protein H6576_01585 [Lewinellaceae bacterium]|nr:hypothetical protein [Saprospiraceae bacterium]MCB9342371.1 hypothetical protein [Lewinellaceae bacterium]
MKLFLPILLFLSMYGLSSCSDGEAAKKAEAEAAAAKEAATLDSLSMELEKKTTEIEKDVQSLEEGLKEIEE